MTKSDYTIDAAVKDFNTVDRHMTRVCVSDGLNTVDRHMTRVCVSDGLNTVDRHMTCVCIRWSY